MDYCGDCVSESPNNDAKFCPDLGYKLPVGTTTVGTTTVGTATVGTTTAGTTTIENPILQSASPLLTVDVHSPELQVKTKGIVNILLGIGLLVVAIGMMMAVASIIFLFVSGM